MSMLTILDSFLFSCLPPLRVMMGLLAAFGSDLANTSSLSESRSIVLLTELFLDELSFITSLTSALIWHGLGVSREKVVIIGMVWVDKEGRKVACWSADCVWLLCGRVFTYSTVSDTRWTPKMPRILIGMCGTSSTY